MSHLFLLTKRRKRTVAAIRSDLKFPERADTDAAHLTNRQIRGICLGGCCPPIPHDGLYCPSLSSAEHTQAPTTPATATNPAKMASDGKPKGQDSWCGFYVTVLSPFYSRYCERFLNWVGGLISKKWNLTATTAEPPHSPLLAIPLSPPPPSSPPTPSIPKAHQAPSHTREALLQLQRETEILKELLAEARREGQRMKNQADIWQLQLQVTQLEVEVAFLGRDLRASLSD